MEYLKVLSLLLIVAGVYSFSESRFEQQQDGVYPYSDNQYNPAVS